MSSAAGIMVLSFPAAAIAGYWTLAQTARNNDGPWLAVFVAFTVWLGVMLLGMSAAI